MKSKDVELIDSALSKVQNQKLTEIKELFTKFDTVLLDGVTGSGKTKIYIELIKDAIAKGKQVLYLLPEIALTAQIVDRLKNVFGKEVIVYHSKISGNSRVEIFQASKNTKIILGPRSALFLPYKNLGLIIVDEEHDGSYKQQNPAPRYHARDASLVLAKYFECKVILGTATPSMESWLHAKNKKYGFVELKERYGDATLPDIELINLQEQYKKNQMESYFSKPLIEAIRDNMVMKRQVILFQNRRGFSPVIQCNLCGWACDCRNCDTTMTVHQIFEELRCHYCGYRQNIPKECPSCGNEHLNNSGFGTERIEAELKKILPEARVKRFDYDTTKSQNAYLSIIDKFTNQEIDILVGTQMITKGLDFENVNLVGILNADKLMHFPDFRANERAIQLMIQVAGRAGRRALKGKVMIQTFNPSLSIFNDVVNSDLDSFYYTELKEREQHHFPPYIRMIKIVLQHKKVNIVKEASNTYAMLLQEKMGNRVSDAFEPSISRLRGYYIRHINIKIEKDANAIQTGKQWISYLRTKILNIKGYSSLRINIDVDPN